MKHFNLRLIHGVQTLRTTFVTKKKILDKYNKNNNSSKVQSRCLYSRVYVFVYATYMWLLKKKFKQERKILTKCCHESEKDGKCGRKKRRKWTANKEPTKVSFCLYSLRSQTHLTFHNFSFLFPISSPLLGYVVLWQMKWREARKIVLKYFFIWCMKISI